MEVKAPVIGRPTLFREEMCQMVVDLMYEGASIEDLQSYLGVHKDTIYQWIKKHPSFADAIKLGRGLSEGWWSILGRENLWNKEFSPALWYMNMKNRHGWRDKFESSHEIAITKVEEESRYIERDCYNEV